VNCQVFLAASMREWDPGHGRTHLRIGDYRRSSAVALSLSDFDRKRKHLTADGRRCFGSSRRVRKAGVSKCFFKINAMIPDRL
jgi:hypothetical protein